MADSRPILQALFRAFGETHKMVMNNVTAAQAAAFMQDATGVNLDAFAADFFDDLLPRCMSPVRELDDDYRARIKQTLLLPVGTMVGMRQGLQTILQFTDEEARTRIVVEDKAFITVSTYGGRRAGGSRVQPPRAFMHTRDSGCTLISVTGGQAGMFPLTLVVGGTRWAPTYQWRAGTQDTVTDVYNEWPSYQTLVMSLGQWVIRFRVDNYAPITEPGEYTDTVAVYDNPNVGLRYRGGQGFGDGRGTRAGSVVRPLEGTITIVFPQGTLPLSAAKISDILNTIRIVRPISSKVYVRFTEDQS